MGKLFGGDQGNEHKDDSGPKDKVDDKPKELEKESAEDNLKYGPLYRAGCKAGIEQMIANDHKKGWDDVMVPNVMEDIRINVSNLGKLMGNASRTKTSSSKRGFLMSARVRASNVYNFAGMIILKCDKELAELEAQVKSAKETEKSK